MLRQPGGGDGQRMQLKLDHVMLAVRDMDDAIRRYQALGFNVRRGGRHPGRGTENAVMRFGWEYLELIAVHDAAERARLGAEGAGLTDFLQRRVGGPVDPVFSTDALNALIERFRKAGVEVTGPVPLQRVRPDGVVVANRCAQPGGRMSTRQLYPGFIQWDRQDPERMTGEWAGTHDIGAVGVAGISIAVADLMRATQAYRDLLGWMAQDEELVPELGARRVRGHIDELSIDLLAPMRSGPVQSELEQIGEGPFELRLRVQDLSRSKARLASVGIAPEPAPGCLDGWLLPIERTVGTRIVLVR